MSIAGVALVLGHVAVSGAGPEADEGTAARLWWLLRNAAENELPKQLDI